MNKKFLLASVFFLFAYIVSLLLLKNYYQAKIGKLTAETETCRRSAVPTGRNTNIGLNDVYLFAQKDKKIAETKKGKLTFDYRLTKIYQTAGESSWSIDLLLAGEQGRYADAADLQLDFDDKLQVVDIRPGTAFPLYPRKITEKKYTLITGLASIDKNNIDYGRPGKIFATLTVKKGKNQAVLTLNRQNSKIYFAGENVFDDENSFHQIILP